MNKIIIARLSQLSNIATLLLGMETFIAVVHNDQEVHLVEIYANSKSRPTTVRWRS